MAARTSGRIVMPTKPSDILDLAKKIYDKHIADGAESPLNAMKDYSWAEDGPKIQPCKENNDNAELHAKKSEEMYRQRDIDMPAIKAIVKNSAALLKSIYAKNPKVLGDYGLIVDDSKQVKK
jgi:hypothetical protein